MSDAGVWVKLEYASAAGAAVVSSHSGGSLESGVTIDGKTYDIYTFTDDTATDMSITLSSSGMARVQGNSRCGGIRWNAEDLIAEYPGVLRRGRSCCACG